MSRGFGCRRLILMRSLSTGFCKPLLRFLSSLQFVCSVLLHLIEMCCFVGIQPCNQCQEQFRVLDFAPVYTMRWNSAVDVSSCGKSAATSAAARSGWSNRPFLPVPLAGALIPRAVMISFNCVTFNAIPLLTLNLRRSSGSPSIFRKSECAGNWPATVAGGMTLIGRARYGQRSESSVLMEVQMGSVTPCGSGRTYSLQSH